MRALTIPIIICITLLLGILLIGKAYNFKFKAKNTVNVVGSAQHNFTSDLIVWSATFTKTSMELRDAYSSLKQDEKEVRDYLQNHGIDPNEAIFSSISIEKQYDYRYDEMGRQTSMMFKGFQLHQTVKIESKEIDKVEKISREITELLQSGIELSSQEPYYYYTKLSDLKISLLSQASADAHNRAASIAKNAKSSLGSLRKASMGVFQIVGQHSNEDYSYGGTFNISSKNKSATITVRLEYELN